jgi:L-rhamnose mutarotase
MQRRGETIKLKPEGLKAYKEYHSNPRAEVNDMIRKCNLRNYTIFQRGDRLFAYYEYVGTDFEADMKKMASDKATQDWWDIVKPLMQPLSDKKEGEFWSPMEEVYHLD